MYFSLWEAKATMKYLDKLNQYITFCWQLELHQQAHTVRQNIKLNRTKTYGKYVIVFLLIIFHVSRMFLHPRQKHN